MKKHQYQWLIWTIILTSCLSSCGTSKPPKLDYQALAHASLRLGVDLEFEDNHHLYIEASNWIGVPYRSGGTTRKGVDCSGLASNIYRSVYNKSLRRSTDEQMKQASKVSRGKLKEGDLVFFSSRNSRKKVAHVGIYLKDGKFVHASSSRGVIVSNLNEPYYRTHWMRGGRIN